MNQKEKKKWFKPLFVFDDDEEPKKKAKVTPKPVRVAENIPDVTEKHAKVANISHKNWMKNFDPETVEDLAVNNKKVQELEEWLKSVSGGCCSDILLLTGPVGCGKTATVLTLAAKHYFKISEWITPLDVEIPMDYGDYEFREKQSTKFLDFILNAANFTSLLDNNSKKLVLVEDFPNTFLRTPSEFTDILHQYRQRAKSPILFICSESHTDSRNTAANLFTPLLKDQLQIQHIMFNGVSVTGLRAALKRVADIISRKKHCSMYNTPTQEMIECVVNSSGGDVRSAVLNLHFACLKGSCQSLETSLVAEKGKKTKSTKGPKKKKAASSKFMSLGKDQTVSILHGVGRVLNPKVGENGNLTHAPSEITEQFVTQPTSFINFLEENYLPHFSCPDHVCNAASALSTADFMLSEWREKICQEYGLYTAITGIMLANKAPVSAWNPVRGPKNMKVQYPTCRDIPLLEDKVLYKGKILVTDYQTYCKIIVSETLSNSTNGIHDDDDFQIEQ